MTRMGDVRRQDRGAGSILILMAITVVMTALLAATVLVSGQLARRQAAAAADLAALTAANQLRNGHPDPCATATVAAEANGGTLSDCVIIGLTVEVQVTVPVTALRDWVPDQSRRARAGPVTLPELRGDVAGFG